MDSVKVNPASLGLLGDDNWLSVVTIFDLAGHHAMQVMSDHSLSLPQSRLSRYIAYLHRKYITPYLICSQNGRSDISLRYIFQGEDCPRDIPSVTWEKRPEWNNITLVPDLYYFMERGYEDFLGEGADLPSWSSRRNAVAWRGSTTGVVHGAGIHQVGFSMETLERLPRYDLCRRLQALGDQADAGIVALVQCPDGEKADIAQRLEAEGLTKPYLPLTDMAHFKYLIDIDGNTNSWNFIQRLRLGCCMIKVESPWVQWFHNRIQPWTHYVPVKQDLSDLAEKVEWCRTHDDMARQIAENGRRFSLEMHFEQEMKQAALDILRVSSPIAYDPTKALVHHNVYNGADRWRGNWNEAIKGWSAFPEPMWLKTVHGTILGRDQGGAIVQMMPDDNWAEPIILSDDNRGWTEHLRGFHMDRFEGRMTLERAGHFLCALPDGRNTVVDRLEIGEWEVFTLVAAR